MVKRMGEQPYENEFPGPRILRVITVIHRQMELEMFGVVGDFWAYDTKSPFTMW